MTEGELKIIAANVAEDLKSKMNKSERYLWETLKKHNKKYGTKWQCQVPVVMDLPVRRAFKTKPFYIMDFIEVEHKTIIEVDGPHHQKYVDSRADIIRDTALAKCGLLLIEYSPLMYGEKQCLSHF